MIKQTLLLLSFLLLFGMERVQAQVFLNEGSNRNASQLSDEDGDYPDWVELYHTGSDTLNLDNYSISDDPANPLKWVFPSYKMPPHSYKAIYCSGKDRKPFSSFVEVVNTGTFTPVVGWNNHPFTTPFYWDGVSNILINTCSFSSLGYTVNSVFNQSATPFLSTVYAFQDGSPASCSALGGTPVMQRPNMQLNGHTLGTGTLQNGPYDYPAPYGNWYWGSRHQMLILASELTSIGLTAGYINSLAFDIASTDPGTVYDYIDISMKLVSENTLSSSFETLSTSLNLHTNFTIKHGGETVYLYNPAHVLLDSLHINCKNLNSSVGCLPDTSANIRIFQTATPEATNNGSIPFTAYELEPQFNQVSGYYSQPIQVSIYNLNPFPSRIYYTLDGSDPDTSSAQYTGTPVLVAYSCVLKARAIDSSKMPSPIACASFLFGVNHVTPVLSIITDQNNLYGPNGIFDNWQYDWQKAAYVEYFDSTHQIVFSQNAAIQIDGGAGGSRSQPQHSMRVELNNSVFGDGSLNNYPLIPNRPNRTTYSSFYLRNGSNQYLTLPYKDATQELSMCGATNAYYSAWRPVSVYINGNYFGLYELREKFDNEYFKTLENASNASTSILSLSYWYGGVLRAVTGSVDTFWNSYTAFTQLQPSDTNYWDEADHYFDLQNYTDYIISEDWMANVDWPWNNIKIYRDDISHNRWRFCTVDQELALSPNGWTDCNYDHLGYMLSQSTGIPYINVWLQSMQNPKFHDYFINRFADVMNTAYLYDRIGPIENSMFLQTFVEMQREFARWGDPNNVQGQMSDFTNNHLIFEQQLQDRTPQVRNHIQGHFNLPQQVDVTLDVQPAGAGQIHISTITPGPYPWHGVYFDGLPVRIEALPNPGYHFLHWGNNAVLTDTLNAVFNDTLSASALGFTAYFAQDPNAVTTPQANGQGLLIFPNPASNVLYLKSNGQPGEETQEASITDLSGKQLMNSRLSLQQGSAVLNIAQLPAGSYLLCLRNRDGRSRQFLFVKAGE